MQHGDDGDEDVEQDHADQVLGVHRDAGVTCTSVIGTACTVRRQCRVDCSRCS
jgi:hypothetical protein